MPSAESNKAKIANRVIEVLDFFDDVHSEATVMDIVRRYNRPQSSTSELLSSLVNLGLLYKDPVSRSYSPTPRAALLGSTTQPDIIRDGRLVSIIDRLVAQTGLGVAVFGMVDLNVRFSPGAAATPRLVTRAVKVSAAVCWSGCQTAQQASFCCPQSCSRDATALYAA